jgi:LysM repeat protein
MFRYQNNAFRILGLKPNASTKEITKRVNEIKVKISLGINVEYDYDFHFMGPLNRDEQNILNALQRLENPILRLKEEIFWFWFETDSDIEAISYLTQDNRNGAHNIWDVQLNEGNFTEKSISAYFNQIILAHSTVIEEESKEYSTAQGKIQNKNSITLDENHWNNWQLVIDRFILLATNNLFWDMVQKKAERIADPRLSNKKVNEIRNNFLNDIVQPNFSLISQALNKKDFSTIKKHLNFFYDNFIPDDSKIPTEVLREGFNKILASHTDFLNEYTRNAEIEFEKTKKDSKNLGKLIELIIDLYRKLVSETKNIIYEGNLVDIKNISDFSLAKDKAAEMIRLCAVILFNSLVDNYSYKGKKEILFRSYIMIRKAIEYSGNYHSSKRIGEDEENIKRYLEYTFGYYKFTDIYNKIQGQENDYDRIMQKQEKDQGTIKEDIEEEKKPKFNWVSMLIYGIAILFFIFIFTFPFDSYDNTTNTSTPPKETSSYSFNNEQNQLEVMIDELEEELRIKERRLEEMKSTLESSYARIINLETKLENIDSKINSTFLINEKNKLIDEYNQTFGEYDRLINSHNDFYSEYEKLYEEYEGDISVYNTLVDSYKTGTMPSFIQENQVDSEIEFTIYTVKAGDSLSKIAKNFNTTVEIIAKQNNLDNLNIIRPGQKLIIPQ